MNLPNKLSILRLILIPVFVTFFYINFPFHYIISAFVFACSAFTDFLDGYIARKYNLVTDLGKFLDASADKVLVLSAMVLLCDAHVVPYVWGGIGVGLILAREILISCLRMVAASKGVVMAADKLGKFKTLCQDLTIVILLVGASFVNKAGEIITYVGYGFFIVAIILTVVSGLHYLIVNRKALSVIEK